MAKKLLSALAEDTCFIDEFGDACKKLDMGSIGMQPECFSFELEEWFTYNYDPLVAVITEEEAINH